MAERFSHGSTEHPPSGISFLDILINKVRILMQRSRPFIVLFVAICIFGLPAAISGSGQDESRDKITNPLVGVWRFEGETDTQAGGKVVATTSAREKHGFIVYTPDMFVTALIMPSDRRWILDSATREELVASADDGTAYAGRYEVNSATHTVTHILSVSLEPTYEGQRLARGFELQNDLLALSGTYSSNGQTYNFTLQLRKVHSDGLSRPDKQR